MNGYLEIEPKDSSVNNYPVVLFGADARNRNIFDAPNKNKYWVINASLSGPSLSNIWHFSEDGISRYLDINMGINNGLLVFPDSYQEASYRLSKWHEFESLEVPNFAMQDCKFQANISPTVLDLITPDWQKAISGELAYDARMPYACYNWEIFFHAPLMIADQLSKQHKFEDAERWLRYVFDPTEAEPSGDAKRFLKFRVFKELKLQKQVIDDMKDKIKKLAISKGLGICPVLLHISGVSRGVFEKNYFYRIIDIMDMIAP